MTVKQLMRVLRAMPPQYHVGVVVECVDGDEFHEIEPSDIALAKTDNEGNELPFGIAVLGTWRGDWVEQDPPAMEHPTSTKQDKYSKEF